MYSSAVAAVQGNAAAPAACLTNCYDNDCCYDYTGCCHDYTDSDTYSDDPNTANPKQPLIDQVAAISCGVYQGEPVLDLDYDEDSHAEIDANFILSAERGIVEIQATGEERPYSRDELNRMLDLADIGCAELFGLQTNAVQKMAP